MWRTEVVANTMIRVAGTPVAPPLRLVHGLGESSLSFVPPFATSLASAFAGVTPADPGVLTVSTLRLAPLRER
jgi:hypothetical protein